MFPPPTSRGQEESVIEPASPLQSAVIKAPARTLMPLARVVQPFTVIRMSPAHDAVHEDPDRAGARRRRTGVVAVDARSRHERQVPGHVIPAVHSVESVERIKGVGSEENNVTRAERAGRFASGGGQAGGEGNQEAPALWFHGTLLRVRTIVMRTTMLSLTPLRQTRSTGSWSLSRVNLARARRPVSSMDGQENERGLRKIRLQVSRPARRAGGRGRSGPGGRVRPRARGAGLRRGGEPLHDARLGHGGTRR